MKTQLTIDWSTLSSEKLMEAEGWNVGPEDAYPVGEVRLEYEGQPYALSIYRAGEYDKYTDRVSRFYLIELWSLTQNGLFLEELAEFDSIRRAVSYAGFTNRVEKLVRQYLNSAAIQNHITISASLSIRMLAGETEDAALKRLEEALVKSKLNFTLDPKTCKVG